ncbi:hypothetical protein BU16DRAFT_156116 [Lophium mytilinum]|uniref:Uncharacterized protein n=1 Tax=Lophium mytilinum TaxID=390894 RepID=A0A6A6QGA4_9PEZI|nr:hypothetical protein BU16DRAFT_156116 [Lophium mytilinum]
MLVTQMTTADKTSCCRRSPPQRIKDPQAVAPHVRLGRPSVVSGGRSILACFRRFSRKPLKPRADKSVPSSAGPRQNPRPRPVGLTRCVESRSQPSATPDVNLQRPPPPSRWPSSAERGKRNRGSMHAAASIGSSDGPHQTHAAAAGELVAPNQFSHAPIRACAAALEVCQIQYIGPT